MVAGAALRSSSNPSDPGNQPGVWGGTLAKPHLVPTSFMSPLGPHVAKPEPAAVGKRTRGNRRMEVAKPSQPMAARGSSAAMAPVKVS